MLAQLCEQCLCSAYLKKVTGLTTQQLDAWLSTKEFRHLVLE